MRTFRAYFKKEIIEAIRQYRYLVLLIGIIIFAVLDPIMLKLLPKLLEGQVNADISTMFHITRKFGYQNYMEDLVQIGFLVVAFTLAGLLSDELSGRRLVFPYSKGAIPAEIVLAKFFHYSLFTVLAVLVGFMANYYYVGLLLTGEDVAFTSILISALLVSFYFIFNIAMIMLFSSLVRKSYIAGIISLLIAYISIALSGIKSIAKLIPYQIVGSASAFSYEGIAPTLAVMTAYIIILLALTSYRMSKAEII